MKTTEKDAFIINFIAVQEGNSVLVTAREATKGTSPEASRSNEDALFPPLAGIIYFLIRLGSEKPAAKIKKARGSLNT